MGGEGEQGAPSSLAICVERIILSGLGLFPLFRRVPVVELGVWGVGSCCAWPPWNIFCAAERGKTWLLDRHRCRHPKEPVGTREGQGFSNLVGRYVRMK